MSLSNEAIECCEDILNSIKEERSLASEGSDEGLIPIYALLNDVLDSSEEYEPLVNATRSMLEQLDLLLDNAQSFNSATLNNIDRYTEWLDLVIHELRSGKANIETFSIKSENQKSISKKSDESPKETDDANSPANVDVLLVPNVKDDLEVLREFYTESVEHLDQIEADLLVLEEDPRNDECLNSVFRSFHSVKGVSGFLHLTPINRLSHAVESVLVEARRGDYTLDSAMITLILESRDIIQTHLDQIGAAIIDGTMPDEIIPVSHLIQQINSQQKSNPGKLPKESSQPSAANDPTVGGKEAQAKRTSNLPKVSSTGNTSVRVTTTKLDSLMDMVGELVIAQSQLYESFSSSAHKNTELERNLTQLLRTTRELQHTSMSLRMIPLKPTFQKMSRLVRDLAKSVGKEINFSTSGEDTELDRNIIQEIGDPLLHMIRNSIDHGLEIPEERKKNGKHAAGSVHLEAYQRGGNIVIELQDDGRGIDPEKILEKAQKQGLVQDDSNLSKQEILQLIFHPGFSTAEKITEISGRGVGMDVVKKNIQNLRGTVEIESEVGKGTTLKIKLPLTMAIIDGLIVTVGPQRFIVPTTSVNVSLRPTPDQISTIQGQIKILEHRNENIPIVPLSEFFDIDTNITDPCDGIIIIIESFGNRYGLLVDSVTRKQEVVIKNLGNLVKNKEGIAGGAILGDGKIALILDPTNIFTVRHLKSA